MLVAAAGTTVAERRLDQLTRAAWEPVLAELRRLHSEADARERDLRDLGEREHRQETLIARLRREAEVRDEELAAESSTRPAREGRSGLARTPNTSRDRFGPRPLRACCSTPTD